MADGERWGVQSELDYLKDWLRAENAELYRDKPRNDLTAVMHNEAEVNLGVVANELNLIALWEKQLGAYNVLQINFDGWIHLRRAVEYSGYAVQFDHAYCQMLQAKRLKVTADQGKTIRCLTLAMALRVDAVADWCGHFLLQPASASNSLYRLWGSTPFFPYMARLYARWRGHEEALRGVCAVPMGVYRRREERFPTILEVPLGIYQQVFDGWQDDNRFSVAISAMCDHHCERSVFQDEHDDPEFYHPPFPVFPAEVLATQRVRRELRGPSVEVRHPLLDTPLGRVPSAIPLPQDELLERVVARMKELFPSLVEDAR